MMDWNGNLRVPFATRPDNPLSFLCNFNYDQFPAAGLEMRQPAMVQATTQHTMQLPTLMDKNNISTSSMNDIYGQQDPKKKRLSNEQLESLENSFQEEIKLDPDRKMKLAKELGLQPRQIAVWFQNRRARWKSKQLERLYDTLKQEFDVVSREKHKLQQEVLALRAILKEEVTKKQVSAGYTEASGGEETVESTSMAGSDKPCGMSNVHQVTECNYALNPDDYNQVMMTPYNWASLPPCP